MEDYPFEIGKAYLIRTVTHYWTGKVTAIRGGFLVLADCAWIPDTGRFSDIDGPDSLNEIEPARDGAGISIASIVDFIPWTWPLPTIRK